MIRKISEKIERKIMVIVVNISIIIITKVPNNLILNLGLVGNTFILQLSQNIISF
jgi:hypothetical protein